MSKDIYVLIEHIQGKVSDLSYMMLAQGRQLVKQTGGDLYGVLLGSQIPDVSKDLDADCIWYYDHPSLADFTWNAYLKVLADLITENQPRLLLMGETTIGSDIAGALSVRLAVPLISCCRLLTVENDCITYTSQICGGKMMVEGPVDAPVSLITMIPGSFKAEQGKGQQPPPMTMRTNPDLEGLQVRLKQYDNPDTGDVDITREKVLVAVGRGIQREDNMDLVNELAEVLQAAVCATRPVIDQGWLPTTRLVGKSGKTVNPTVYLALGISGAPEHSEAITGSGMIIAVNTDPAAPIFDLARYGTQVDLLDLLPVLIDQIRARTG